MILSFMWAFKSIDPWMIIISSIQFLKYALLLSFPEFKMQISDLILTDTHYTLCLRSLVPLAHCLP